MSLRTLHRLQSHVPSALELLADRPMLDYCHIAAVRVRVMRTWIWIRHHHETLLPTVIGNFGGGNSCCASPNFRTANTQHAACLSVLLLVLRCYSYLYWLGRAGQDARAHRFCLSFKVTVQTANAMAMAPLPCARSGNYFLLPTLSLPTVCCCSEESSLRGKWHHFTHPRISHVAAVHLPSRRLALTAYSYKN